MKIPCLLLAGGALLGAGCRSAPPVDETRGAPPAPAPATSATASAGYKAYGAKLVPDAATKLASVLEEPDRYQGKTVTVEGKVRRACTRKGCWMEIGDASDPAVAGCRVTFKDYGFFVPIDSAGAEARVQGVVAVETVAARYVKHLEEEGARFASKADDGTAREVRLVANGVELKK